MWERGLSKGRGRKKEVRFKESKVGVGNKPVWPSDKPRMLTELGSGGPWRPGTEGRARANRRGTETQRRRRETNAAAMERAAHESSDELGGSKRETSTGATGKCNCERRGTGSRRWWDSVESAQLLFRGHL